MTNTATIQDAQKIVQAFFDTKEKRDFDSLVALFSDDVVYSFPLNASGAPEPWFVYDGKNATSEYQRQTLDRFSQLRMLDKVFTVSQDGTTVFVESRGDYLAQDGRPYRNVYVFKFVLKDGLISRVFEYANPVTFAKLADLPIGVAE